MLTDTLLARDLVPDTLIRQGIRRLLRQRLKDENKGGPEAQQAHLMRFIEDLKQSPIAIETGSANEQHYEVPTPFYQYVLGKHMKYSCGLWDASGRGQGEALGESLNRSEKAMLALTCERAELSDGQDILELGCGWGSLSLYMAGRYPRSCVKAVSNSRTQKTHIDEEARRLGLTNLGVITADMNQFAIGQTFDRVVSVEMFEHMRNYEALLAKVASWLKPEGKLFVHIFVHKGYAYPFEVPSPQPAPDGRRGANAQSEGFGDWMSKYFFTGGVMPSDDLLLYFQRDVTIEKHWQVSGTHYQKTSEAWLTRMDQHRQEILPIFETTYGKASAVQWWSYWRIFFMSCAELWGFRGGNEWFVSHYLFKKK